MGTCSLFSIIWFGRPLFTDCHDLPNFGYEIHGFSLRGLNTFASFMVSKKVAYKNKFQISELQIELLMWQMSNSDLKQRLKLLLWRSATELNETSFGSTPLETHFATTATNSRNSSHQGDKK